MFQMLDRVDKALRKRIERVALKCDVTGDNVRLSSGPFVQLTMHLRLAVCVTVMCYARPS